MAHFYEENPPETWLDCDQCGGCHPPGKEIGASKKPLATAIYEGDCRNDLYRWPSSASIGALIAHPLPEDLPSIHS